MFEEHCADGCDKSGKRLSFCRAKGNGATSPFRANTIDTVMSCDVRTGPFRAKPRFSGVCNYRSLSQTDARQPPPKPPALCSSLRATPPAQRRAPDLIFECVHAPFLQLIVSRVVVEGREHLDHCVAALLPDELFGRLPLPVPLPLRGPLLPDLLFFSRELVP